MKRCRGDPVKAQVPIETGARGAYLGAFVAAGPTVRRPEILHLHRRCPFARSAPPHRVDILLTNDDGIGATGLRALRAALEQVGDVTVVAPADDQSAVGRAVSDSVGLESHDAGWVVEGTPSDAVLAGLEALGGDVDLVVAGCNRGANLGTYVLGRSGTISAAVEAAFLGVPSMAVSLWVPTPGNTAFETVTVDRDAYAVPADAARYLVERADEGALLERTDTPGEAAGYLNVNAPVPDRATGGMRVTKPSHVHDVTAVREGDTVHMHDNTWDLMERDPADLPDPEGSDRRAVVEGHVSVSPLVPPHDTGDHHALDQLAARYEGLATA